MTNHPNRRAVYRVDDHAGHFAHVAGKRAAVVRGIAMVGAPSGTTAQELDREWGVTISRVSASIARSVGL